NIPLSCDLITITVTPKSPGLNPNANVFQSKSPASPESQTTPQWPPPATPPEETVETTEAANTEGYEHMNGDTESSSLLPGTASPQPSDSPLSNTSITDLPILNGVVEQTLPEAEPSSASTGEELLSPPIQGTIPESQLCAMLKNQLEYYFSRDNLANDSYLVSQMDGDQYVPIATIAGFNQVRKLTDDIELVRDVLRSSAHVQVDEKGEKVRPLHKRCIVILREVPESTPVEEVKALFSGENCPKFVSCEFAGNSNWYVTFDSDEDAQRAYGYLREDVQTFLGKPIMARIKAKPLVLRNNFVPKTANGVVKPVQTPPAYEATQMFPIGVSTAPQQAAQRFSFQQPPVPPNMQYMTNNGQPPFQFYANTMIGWPTSPTAAFFGDPGMVLAANGFTPGGTITKFNNQAPTRHTYVRNSNQVPKPHSRVQSNPERLSGSADAPPRMERQLSASQRTSPRHNSESGLYNSQMSSRTHREFTPQHHSTQGPTQVDMPKSVSPRSENGHIKESLPSRGSRMESRYHSNRNRRREDDRTKNSRLSGTPNGVKHDVKPELPKSFELESTSFPPLPGSTNATTTEEVPVEKVETKKVESKMSDVVKGTAKMPSKPPVAPGSPSKSSREVAAGESDPIHVDTPTTSSISSPPLSPIRPGKASSTKPPVEKVKPTEDTSNSHKENKPTKAPSKKKEDATKKKEDATNIPQKETKASSSHKDNVNSSKDNKPATIPDSNTVSEEDKLGPPKLSYAQMAQRAREREAEIKPDAKQTEGEQKDTNNKDKAVTLKEHQQQGSKTPSTNQQQDTNTNKEKDEMRTVVGRRTMKENRANAERNLDKKGEWRVRRDSKEGNNNRVNVVK
ncbi:unnamed protein product, partial [Owenia fusiformis]